MQRLSLLILRVSLGMVFVWFGALKILNCCPVLEILEKALPLSLAQSSATVMALGIVEFTIGAGFLANLATKLLSLAMIAHLLVATANVLITQGFEPHFPMLSLAGEFVIKNLVLITGAVVIFSHQTLKK